MVKLIINGNAEREFKNMAQALAFAYQNGKCYGAQKIEIVMADAAGCDESGMNKQTKEEADSRTKAAEEAVAKERAAAEARIIAEIEAEKAAKSNKNTNQRKSK